MGLSELSDAPHYIGTSTRAEIAFAVRLGKGVRYWSAEKIGQLKREIGIMDIKEYQKEVMRTAPPTDGLEDVLKFCALGITGEGGEVADLIKKWCWHKHNLDHRDLALELGDVLWYVTRMSLALGYNLDAIMQANVEKLGLRYPEGFSSEASRNRKG